MTEMLKQIVTRVFGSMGYRLVPTWRWDRMPQATYLRKLFKLCAVDCVLDVGANDGQFRDFLRLEIGFEGPIFSFEPIPEKIERLRDRSRLDRLWFVEGCALGARAGDADFNVMASSQFSSFLQPDHSSVSLFKDKNQVIRTVRAEIKTLDGIFPDLRRQALFTKPYLKLDTQGFDLEVIKGGEHCLSQFVALQSEASVRAIYHGLPHFSDVIATLEGKGFDLSGIFPNNMGHFPLLIDFDCHMIRRDYLSLPSASKTFADITS